MIIVSLVAYEDFEVIGCYENIKEVKKNVDAILELKKKYTSRSIWVNKHCIQKNGLFDLNKTDERTCKTKEDILNIEFK